MRTIEKRDTSTGERRRKVRVDILGRGRNSVKVKPTDTVKDLRENLDIKTNVRAVDSEGKRLEENKPIYDEDEINFVPNVKGGEE